MIGRFLLYDNAAESYYTVSRFAEQVGEYLYLMEICSPRTGDSSDDGYFIVNLHMLAIGPEDDPAWPTARIFPTWEALLAFTSEMNGPPKEVVKLVRPERTTE